MFIYTYTEIIPECIAISVMPSSQYIIISWLNQGSAINGRTSYPTACRHASGQVAASSKPLG